jgi:GDP-4-dehydro-6-deoxy-D-mannose reductase
VSGTLWITGVAGFSGRYLVEYLRGLTGGPIVVGLDRVEASPDGLDAYVRLDLTDPYEVTRAAGRHPPDRVIHLVAAMPPADEVLMWQVNVGGVFGLLWGLHQAGCSRIRVVSVGSAAEYTMPATCPLSEDSPASGASVYGRTKSAQTGLALALGRDLGLDVMVARTFNLTGPGLSSRLVAGWLCEQFAREDVPEIEIGNMASARDFLDVRDAVRAYWLLACVGIPGTVYNVCSGKATTVERLLELMSQISGRCPEIKVAAERVRASDPSMCYGDAGRLHEATGWSPEFSLEASLRDMMNERRAAHAAGRR